MEVTSEWASLVHWTTGLPGFVCKVRLPINPILFLCLRPFHLCVLQSVWSLNSKGQSNSQSFISAFSVSEVSCQAELLCAVTDNAPKGAGHGGG